VEAYQTEISLNILRTQIPPEKAEESGDEESSLKCYFAGSLVWRYVWYI